MLSRTEEAVLQTAMPTRHRLATVVLKVTSDEPSQRC